MKEPLLKAVIPKSVVLELALEDHLPLVNGDVAQFRQVVMNLIINAAEAIGDRSGYVNVSTGTIYVDKDGTLALHKSEELTSGEHVYVEVADNGSGMDQSELERVFDPFYTTKFTGRGLGLAVVLGIVAAWRSGQLAMGGDKLCVLLPPAWCVCAQAGDDRAMFVLGSASRGRRPAIRTVTKEHLARISMTVLARDGKEGARMFSEMADQVDLVWFAGDPQCPAPGKVCDSGYSDRTQSHDSRDGSRLPQSLHRGRSGGQDPQHPRRPPSAPPERPGGQSLQPGFLSASGEVAGMVGG
jgi:hypothetical protein